MNVVDRNFATGTGEILTDNPVGTASYARLQSQGTNVVFVNDPETASMQCYKSISLALFLFLAGCASLGTKVETYSGEYFYNFEHAYLTPGGLNEQWCLKGDMSQAELHSNGGRGVEGTSYITVQGTLGPQGSYGNLGACKRILTVTKLVKVTNMRGGS